MKRNEVSVWHQVGTSFMVRLGSSDLFTPPESPMLSVKLEGDRWIAAFWTSEAGWRDVPGSWSTRQDAEHGLLAHCSAELQKTWAPLLESLSRNA